MPVIKIKRVYEEESKDDGLRVLVDRLWPRGIKKEALHYNKWAKEITPSAELRTWVHQDPENRWKEFTQKYTKELDASGAFVKFLQEIQSYKTVTLLYAAKDTTRNHAIILKSHLDKALGQKS